MGRIANMFRAVLDWWRLRQATTEVRVARFAERDLRAASLVMDGRERDASRLYRRIRLLADALAEDMEVFDRERKDLSLMQQRAADALEQLRARLEILENTTVPGLVEAVEMFREQRKAEIAMQIHRRIGSITEREG